MAPERITHPWGERTPRPRRALAERVDPLAGACPRTSRALVADGVDAALQRRRYDYAIRDGEIVGVAVAVATASIAAGWAQGPVRLAGQFGEERLTRPLFVSAASSARPTGRRRWAGSSRRRRELLDSPGGWGRFGFYTSGQLFAEEYYTLGVIGKGGLGTPHMDGNTRLCTATAAAALKENFGTDGQPGSYADVDHCDAIALYGHNVVGPARTCCGPGCSTGAVASDPPGHAVRRPTPGRRSPTRPTSISPRSLGTNQALMNGLIRELLKRGWYDRGYVERPHDRTRGAPRHRRQTTTRNGWRRSARSRPRTYAPPPV